MIAVVILGTATKLKTTRNIALSGAVKGNANFDGSGNITISTTLDNVAIITGSITLTANTNENLSNNIQMQTQLNINFPNGFNKDNCVCIAFGMKKTTDKNYSYGTGGSDSANAVTGALYKDVILGAPTDNTKITMQVWQMSTSVQTYYYKLVLLKA